MDGRIHRLLLQSVYVFAVYRYPCFIVCFFAPRFFTFVFLRCPLKGIGGGGARLDGVLPLFTIIPDTQQ